MHELPKTVGDYQLGKTIGKGTFGKVKIGTHTITGEQVAIKILQKNKIIDEGDKQRVTREINILRRIKHPNIIQLYQIIETPSKLYLIMEHADGGELFESIVSNQRLDQMTASKYLQQILNAVEYMHQLGITHRDLKPQNLLLDFKSNIKVVDFGLSNTYQNGDLLKTACGSPCYAAPEMVSGKAYHGLKTDIWSCGIILYAMLCGYLPFEDPDTGELYKKIRTGLYQLPAFISITGRSMLSKILNTNPEQRASIEQIRDHPFNLKKQLPVRGIVDGRKQLLSENILREMSHITNVEEQIHNNKHNRTTATYYLLLRHHLKSQNRSLLDYYRELEYPKIRLSKSLTKGLQKNGNTNIRKRKLQMSTSKTSNKSISNNNRSPVTNLLIINNRRNQESSSKKVSTSSSKQRPRINSERGPPRTKYLKQLISARLNEPTQRPLEVKSKVLEVIRTEEKMMKKISENPRFKK